MDAQQEGSSQEPFETHCVIELSPKCQEQFVDWMIGRITAPRSSKGAELLVRPVRDVNTNLVERLLLFYFFWQCKLTPFFLFCDAV